MKQRITALWALGFAVVMAACYLIATCDPTSASQQPMEDTGTGTPRVAQHRREIPEHLQRARATRAKADMVRRQIAEGAAQAASGDVSAAIKALSIAAHTGCRPIVLAFAECAKTHMTISTDDGLFLCGVCMERAYEDYLSCALGNIQDMEPALRVPHPTENITYAIEREPARLLTEALKETEPAGPAHQALVRASKDPLLAFLIAKESGGSAEFIARGVMPIANALRTDGHRDEAEAFVDTWVFYNALFVDPPSEEDTQTP